MSMTVKEFIFKMQDYSGGKYTLTQLEEVANWAKDKRPERLYQIYRYHVRYGDTQYKTPPAVAALTKMLSDILETYPGLRLESYNQSNLLTDGTDPEAGKIFMSELMKKLSSKKAVANE